MHGEKVRNVSGNLKGDSYPADQEIPRFHATAKTKARNWSLNLNQFNQECCSTHFPRKIHFSIIQTLPRFFPMSSKYFVWISPTSFTSRISFKAISTLGFGLQTEVALSETENGCHIEHSIAMRLIQLIQNHNLKKIYIYIICTIYLMRPKVLTTVSSVRPAGIRRHILVDRYKPSKGPASSICRVETPTKTNGATSHKTIIVVLS
jgi:hypothetical protein